MGRYRESQEREDARAAMICALLANVNRNPKKHPRPYKVEDFMPGKKQQNVQDMVTIAEAITTAFGGEDKRHGKST